MKQQSFLAQLKIPTHTAHGGTERAGKRKLARPFSRKHPLHVVFRSSKARGEFSLLRKSNELLVKRLLDRYARLYRIKVYRFQNVGNHLHLLIQTRARHPETARADLNAFMRRFAGEVAMQITGAKKGSPFQKNPSIQKESGAFADPAIPGRFWDHLVYSRLVTWGREFETLKRYLIKNLFEAAGYWDRKKHPDWKLVTVICDSS